MKVEVTNKMIWWVVGIAVALVSWMGGVIWTEVIIKPNEEQWDAIRGLLNMHIK